MKLLVRIHTRIFSMLLITALFLCSISLPAPVTAQSNTTNIISISSAADLANIGTNSSYPLDGNYKLTTDIDLSGISWTPIGGYYGEKGRVSGSGVFTGTFDGQGHVISGLNMNFSGNIPDSSYYAELGLFGVIGSGDASDYAIVQNIIFTDVDIHAEFTNGLCAAGTLAGDVNGYATVQNIAVLNGSIFVNTTAQCDTVGVGGIIGECRTDSANLSVINKYVTIRNMYNGANVYTNGNNPDHNYAGGILGRVAKSMCKEVSACVNTGEITFDGNEAYGISSVELDNTSYYTNFSNNYVLDGQGIADGGLTVSSSSYLSGILLTGLSSTAWTAKSGYFQVPSICLTSSASGYIYMSGVTPVYANGDSAANVTSDVSLPTNAGGETLTWTSSDPTTLKINEYTAVPDVNTIIDDTYVTLTAKSSSGYTKNFRLKVISNNKMSASFNNDYASVGTPLTVVITNSRGLLFNYSWEVGGRSITNNSNTYTPQSADVEKFINVSITSTDGSAHINLSTYLSELPVVYINTDDGSQITSTTTTKDASCKVQGNNEYNNSETFYNGKCTIKGRGNSTWSMAADWGVKKPYKIKLNKKSNLLGMGNGNNKHWVLLANMIDHTNIRNELTFNFARDIGLEHSPATANVVLILNGEYAGLYELCEHVRIGSSRVDIFDWEELADNIADSIAIAENIDAASLETAMEQNFSWRMNKTFTYQSKTYKLDDYYDTSKIPDFTGGFLMDMDFRISNTSKYISSFRTTMHGDDGIPMFFRSPEYAKTDSTMVSYVKNFLDTYENAINSEDFYTSDLNTKELSHYSDLFDMDSLVKYWLICEFTMNWDSMKNSTYLYKDLTGKAKMGPVWDYDWAYGNINMYSTSAPFLITGWHSTCDQFCEQYYQHYQWNRYLVADPYFILKAYKTYSDYRSTLIEDIIKDGGVLDSSEAKYQTASEANDAKWDYSYTKYSGKAIDALGNSFSTKSQNYNDAFTTLKQYIKQRVAWLDSKFELDSSDTDAAVKNLFSSFGNKVSDKININSVDTSGKDSTTIKTYVSDLTASEVTFQINGTHLITEKINNAAAQTVIDDNILNSGENALNVVEVHAVNSSGSYIKTENNFKVFEKTVIIENTPAPTPKVTSTPRPSVTMTPTPRPTSKPGRETKAPITTASPQTTPSNTPLPSAIVTHAPDSNVIPTPVVTPAVSTDNRSITNNNSIQSSAPGRAVKATLSLSGKSKVNAKGYIILRAITTGSKSKKIRWSLNSKGKKIFKLNKKTGKKVKLSVKKGKSGKGIVIVKCGKLIRKKIINIS